MTDLPIVRAHPSRAELLQSILILPVGTLFFGGWLIGGIDYLFPNFLTESDFATNRLRMGLVASAVFFMLLAYLVSTYRRRSFAVHADRIELGQPPWAVVALHDITRIRVGAPMPGALRAIAGVNRIAGVVSSKNRGAANRLDNAYANTVVIDTDHQSMVFHVGTVHGGAEVLQALVQRAPGTLGEPDYTDEERRRFGRFTPGVYVRAPTTSTSG